MTENRLKYRVYDIRNKTYFNFPDPTPPLNSDGTLGFTIGKPDLQKFYIVEFCTGFFDKNGKLIYEGDIIQNSDKDQYVVEWCIDGYWYIRQADDEKFGCALASIKTLYDGWEIIGNIHEQAEQKD